MTLEEFLDRIDEIMCGTSNAERAYLEDLYDEVTKPQWISVEEELPKKEGLLIVVMSGNADVFEYEGESAVVLKDWYHITHWMPLPQSPKEGGEK